MTHEVEGFFLVGVQVKPGADSDALKSKLLDRIGRLAKLVAFDDAEVDRARRDFSVVSGNSYLGLAGYVIHSQRLHTWSVSPAAIAGVRACQCPSSPGTRNVRTRQQKL